MVLLQSAVPENTREMMLPLSALQSPSASGSMGNYWDSADSGHTQTHMNTEKPYTCANSSHMNTARHRQANAKSHTHVVDCELPAGQIVLLWRRL